MSRYLGGYKKYVVGNFKQLTKVLGEVAKSISAEIEQEAIQIAHDTIEETVYERPLSEQYIRTEEMQDTPIINNKWSNAYGQGFTLSYDTTALSTSPPRKAWIDGQFRRVLGQHTDVEGRDMRDYVMSFVNDGFPIVGSGTMYRGAHFKEITEERIRRRIQEIIDSYR